MTSFFKRLFALFTLSCVFGFHQFKAQTFVYSIPWTPNALVAKNGLNYVVPTIAHEIPSNGVPKFSRVETLKSINFAANIQLIASEAVEASVVSYFTSVGFQPSENVNITATVTREGTDPKLSVVCQPFFYKQGSLHRVVSFQVTLSHLPPKPIAKDYAASSVLEQGNWYKIGVTSDGIYRIDTALLTSLGISTQGCFIAV